MRALTLSSAILGVGTLVGVFVHHASAQQLAPITLTVPAGQVLEIGLDTTVPQPLFSWILTKDREFVTAQRDRFFQTRQTVTGRYTIDVSIQDQGKTKSEHQTFYLDVVDQQVPRVNTLPMTGGMVVPAIGIVPQPSPTNQITVPLEGGLVMIDLSRSQGVSRYAIDLDTTQDTDGDGTPDNDVDNIRTLSERSGTALYYLFRPVTPQRFFGITLTGDAASAPAKQQYNVMFSANAVIPTTPTSQPSGNQIQIDLQQNGLMVRPSIALNPTMIDPSVTLIEWDFGDRSRSLLARPEHTYAAPGIYTVSVVVRNISTGQTEFTGQTQAQAQASSSSSEQPTLPDKTPNETPTTSSGIAGVMKLIGGILLLLAFAIGAFLGLKHLKGRAAGGIQKKLEDMETKMFKDKESGGALANAVIDVTSPTKQDEHLTLRREVPEEEEPTVEPPTAESPVETSTGEALSDRQERDASRTELKAEHGVPEVPVQDAGPVPSWLQGSPNDAAPAPMQPTTPPDATPGPTVAATETQAPTPDWLKQGTTETTSATEATPSVAATPSSVEMTAEERERERKRRKRQRYRQNKRLRETTGTDESTAAGEESMEETTSDDLAAAELEQPSTTPQSPAPGEPQATTAPPQPASDATIATIRVDSLNPPA